MQEINAEAEEKPAKTSASEQFKIGQRFQIGTEETAEFKVVIRDIVTADKNGKLVSSFLLFFFFSYIFLSFQLLFIQVNVYRLTLFKTNLWLIKQ